MATAVVYGILCTTVVLTSMVDHIPDRALDATLTFAYTAIILTAGHALVTLYLVVD